MTTKNNGNVTISRDNNIKFILGHDEIIKHILISSLFTCDFNTCLFSYLILFSIQTHKHLLKCSYFGRHILSDRHHTVIFINSGKLGNPFLTYITTTNFQQNQGFHEQIGVVASGSPVLRSLPIYICYWYVYHHRTYIQEFAMEQEKSKVFPCSMSL